MPTDEGLSTFKRFCLGALGGLLPILVAFAAIKVSVIAEVIDNPHTISSGRYVGMVLQSSALILLGGIFAALNHNVTNVLSLVQLGASAPALLTAYLSTASASAAAGPAPSSHSALPAKGAWLGPSFISAAYASDTAALAQVSAGPFWSDLYAGLTRSIGQTVTDAASKASLGVEHAAHELPTVTTDLDIDRPGEPFLSAVVPDLLTCQRLCVADTKCMAYSFLPLGASPKNWHGPPPPHCWLTNPAPPPKVYKGIISGVRVDR